MFPIVQFCLQPLVGHKEHDPKIAKMRLQDPLHLNKPGLIHGLRHFDFLKTKLGKVATRRFWLLFQYTA